MVYSELRTLLNDKSQVQVNDNKLTTASLRGLSLCKSDNQDIRVN
ncbi:hypothetical protein XSR1_130062 [Xenorhabdus szentirmaii DSM 16338]|uniref:Uncharacterized protein n=1 Tax=Xenorhabdus szentirmaii DSM 16338 TaxID=1427518 RepID=W1IV37_9GAMM|nr:hypothetical protein XSR1_130062 [Xenorhabdus szentirmaii DSM 16338]